MKILKNYIIREISEPFFLGLFIFTFVLLMDKIFDLVDLIINKGVPFFTVSRLFIYILPSFLAITVPMGLLMAILMAYGRLSTDNELTAIKSSGINPLKIANPAIALSLILSLLMIYFNETVLPSANSSFKNLYYEIVQKKASIAMQERLFITEFDGYILYVEKKNDLTGELKNPLIFCFEKNGQPFHTITAQNAVLMSDTVGKQVMLKLNNGIIHYINSKDSNKYTRIFFDSYNIDLDINKTLNPGYISSESISPREMGLTDLNKRIHQSKQNRLNTNYLLLEFHKKISIPFACMTFTLIGIPLASRLKKGSKGVSFGISLLLIFIYYLVLILGETMGDKGEIAPWLGMWLPNITLGIVGIVLLLHMYLERPFSQILQIKIL
ncbi:MAG: LPS export ABC transporter permease LptF [Candidatus Firestonebacteria bacterium]